jgi:hypothetical protein
MPAKHGETDLFFQIWSVEDPDANQTSVGCAIGYLIVLAVLLLDSSPASAAAWSVAFNVPASAARQFVIRRFFN